MPLLNSSTKVSAQQTAQEIMTILARKGATDISVHYAKDAQPEGLRWRVPTPQGVLDFSLPINTQAVFNIMTKERLLVTDPARRMEQANRTAWRITKTWIQAQMALVETTMADFTEVFLPYMLSGDTTLYQHMLENSFQNPLPPGNSPQNSVELPQP